MHVTFVAEAAVNKLLLWLILPTIPILPVLVLLVLPVVVVVAVMTGICSEKCVVRRFHCCANVIGCTYTNLDSKV